MHKIRPVHMCCEGTVCGTYGQICMCFAEKTVLDAKRP
ncbi:hypothetical protein CUS_7560 [Ruminococcus albus 8]|uniref:Uncharacterized protein n=1 Tax=Ruminococcus albus 8 TaxID=246199 RepID=E9SH32_RUMAL|nr:hypothetical protein CUS_7560 [Ruminococcus albus 8]